MIPVADAQALCLTDLARMHTETVPLAQAAGRVLAAPVRAARAQPPFAAAAMDGYAVLNSDVVAGAQFHVIGEAAAGHNWSGTVTPGQALRIFTGAPLPQGADRVIIQEDVTREGDTVTLKPGFDTETYVRPIGADFDADFTLAQPRILRPVDLALLAAMNASDIPVVRKPQVALIATGDELVLPGQSPRDDQIIASNIFALAAMVADAGGVARVFPIVPDQADILRATLSDALSSDLVITIGGASVGDHDLVAAAAADVGFSPAFHKIAMRPGKPLMLGHSDGTPFLGLPGNPVSAIVCGHLFMVPMIRKMLGLPDPLPRAQKVPLAISLGKNGPRAHYMRAKLENGQVTPFARQDSALLTVLTDANCLAIRPPNDGPRLPGDLLDVLVL